MKDLGKISVIIPAYNEELNIKPLIEQLAELKNKEVQDLEVIFVNDGSSDNTLSEIKKYAHDHDFIKVASHEINLGMTAALLTGFEMSSGEIIVIYPADLQYIPKDIPKLLAGFKNGYDVVTGWKKGKYGKKIISFFYNWLSRKIFSVSVHDLNSVKALRRHVFERLQLRKDWHRYIIVLASELGYKINEVRMDLYPRIHGQSKYSGKGRIVIGILDLLSIKFFISFAKKPLLFFGSAGGGFLLLGIIIGLIELIMRFVFQLGFRPILYLVILLIMVGITLFAIGFIAELIVILNERLEEMIKVLSMQIGGKKKVDNE